MADTVIFPILCQCVILVFLFQCFTIVSYDIRNSFKLFKGCLMATFGSLFFAEFERAMLGERACSSLDATR